MPTYIDGSGHFHVRYTALLLCSKQQAIRGDFTLVNHKSCGCKRALQAKYRHSANILPSEVLESCEEFTLSVRISKDPYPTIRLLLNSGRPVQWLKSAGTCFLRVCLQYGAFIWKSNRDRAVVGVTKTTLKPTLVPSMTRFAWGQGLVHHTAPACGAAGIYGVGL